MTHYGSGYIMQVLDRQPVYPQTITVILTDGDTAWNPASTKRGISSDDGEAVRYIQYFDGGLDTTVLDVIPTGAYARRRFPEVELPCPSCDRPTEWRLAMMFDDGSLVELPLCPDHLPVPIG